MSEIIFQFLITSHHITHLVFILERNRRAHRPAPFKRRLVPLESMYMRPAALHIDLCTCQKSGVCFSINHVLRQYISITADTELTIVKLLTDGIVYHTFSS